FSKTTANGAVSPPITWTNRQPPSAIWARAAVNGSWSNDGLVVTRTTAYSNFGISEPPQCHCGLCARAAVVTLTSLPTRIGDDCGPTRSLVRRNIDCVPQRCGRGSVALLGTLISDASDPFSPDSRG